MLRKYWEEVVQYQKAANVIKEYKEKRLKTVKGDTIRKELYY